MHRPVSYRVVSRCETAGQVAGAAMRLEKQKEVVKQRPASVYFPQPGRPTRAALGRPRLATVTPPRIRCKRINIRGQSIGDCRRDTGRFDRSGEKKQAEA